MSAVPASAPRRLFFALWPDAALRAALVRDLAAAVPGGRPVHPEDLHVTLEFLGGVEEPRLRTLLELGERLALPPGELAFDRLAWWRQQALAVALASAPPPALIALQSALRAALAGKGFRVEARAYVPHVTLARRLAAAPAFGRSVPVAWPLATLALVESGAAGGGARYRSLASWSR